MATGTKSKTEKIHLNMKRCAANWPSFGGLLRSPDVLLFGMKVVLILSICLKIGLARGLGLAASIRELWRQTNIETNGQCQQKDDSSLYQYPMGLHENSSLDRQKCGYANSSDPRIHGGEISYMGRFPWLVS